MTALAELTTTTTADAPDPSTGLRFRIAPPLPHVREYEEQDAEAVARMWRESAVAWPGGGPGAGEHTTAARVRQDQQDLNALATFIAWMPDRAGGPGAPERAVGYLSLFDYPSEVNTAYVSLLSAHPDWHGRGIGRDLLFAALERTVALGYERLDLNTWAGNLKAVPLYKKTGFFWVPETTVKMENYLPLIFRLPAAQAFFQEADWYRDFQRDLSVKEDDEKAGKIGVYTYAWQRGERRLRVVIDRKAKGVASLETERYAVSATIDDPKLPIGLHRTVRWQVEQRSGEAPAVSVLATGEDSVRCAFQASARVEETAEWSAAITAEQSDIQPPANRPANRVRSTVVVDGEAVPLLLAAEVVQPVDVRFEAKQRWLSPGVARRAWLTLENNLEERVTGTLRLSTPGLAVELDHHAIEFELEPSGRASWAVTLIAHQRGVHALRAQATLRTEGAEAGELRTRIFTQSLVCLGIGDVVAFEEDDQVKVATDRLLLRVGTKPARDWMPSFGVYDRESEREILRSTVAVGPPFIPSVFTRSTWRSRIERDGAAVNVVLSTTPDTIRDLTFERLIRVSPSGLIEVGFRATNTGEAPRSIQVATGTSVELAMASASQVAVPLASGLVVNDSQRFPDWSEPEVTRPERYAEQWMAEFGDGWVGATIWRTAHSVEAGWETPSLTLDLGTIGPGATAETPPVYLYAGQGDWKTARALWRQLVAPNAPAPPPAPQPALQMAVERTVFDRSPAETALLLTNERARWLSGSVRLEVDGRTAAEGAVEELSVRRPHSLPVTLSFGETPRAHPAAIVLEHERSTERTETAVILAGDGEVVPTITRRDDGQHELVTVANGRFRFVVAPAKLGRMIELSLRDPSEEWVNHLFASYPDATPFVWLNPWYGGIHPSLQGGGGRGSYPGPLGQETFTWERAERIGSQGIRWHGIAVRTETTKGHKGLVLTCSYLTLGGSNLLAIVTQVENRSSARYAGAVTTHTFLAPNGDRTRSTLHYLRFGERTQKRTHGGLWSSSEQWCAVEPPAGPVLTVVGASPEVRVQPGDMGNEGVHPSTTRRLQLDPGQSAEAVTYLVLAEDMEQARLYRHLSTSGGLA